MQCHDDVRIGIVGGGLTGMALARNLAATGARVTVMESAEQLGGLATHHDFGKFTWDRFYHVILPSDRDLIQFIHDLGMAADLCWRSTLTGFYVDKRLHSISNSLEFLRFPLLSLIAKARLAWTLWYGSRIDDWRRLERNSVEDWLVRVSGRSTYEKMWRPLLLAKLGESYRRVSAVFIWSYIKRLFSARHSAAGKEQLGHVAGGYKSVFERVRRLIESSGGAVKTGVRVGSISPAAGGGMIVSTDQGEERFDRVVCTSPVPILKELAHPSLLRVTGGSGDVEYLGVICVIVISTTELVPYYVVNIADEEVPFTGIIGMSNVVSRKQTAGMHLTYLPKYLRPGDPLFKKSDAEIESEFLKGIRHMFPEFDMESIESVQVNRAERVQPLQVLNYSSLVPTVKTKSPDFFVLNTSQFTNATLNNNEVIASVNQFFEQFGDDLTRPRGLEVVR